MWFHYALRYIIRNTICQVGRKGASSHELSAALLNQCICCLAGRFQLPHGAKMLKQWQKLLSAIQTRHTRKVHKGQALLATVYSATSSWNIYIPCSYCLYICRVCIALSNFCQYYAPTRPPKCPIKLKRTGCHVIQCLTFLVTISSVCQEYRTWLLHWKRSSPRIVWTKKNFFRHVTAIFCRMLSDWGSWENLFREHRSLCQNQIWLTCLARMQLGKIGTIFLPYTPLEVLPNCTVFAFLPL